MVGNYRYQPINGYDQDVMAIHIRFINRSTVNSWKIAIRFFHRQALTYRQDEESLQIIHLTEKEGIFFCFKYITYMHSIKLSIQMLRIFDAPIGLSGLSIKIGLFLAAHQRKSSEGFLMNESQPSIIRPYYGYCSNPIGTCISFIISIISYDFIIRKIVLQNRYNNQYVIYLK